jgi:hypothetical protein
MAVPSIASLQVANGVDKDRPTRNHPESSGHEGAAAAVVLSP